MRKGRDYNVWKDDWTMVSLCEWVASVKAGKRASIVQVLGKFGENRTVRGQSGCGGIPLVLRGGCRRPWHDPRKGDVT